MRRMTMAFAGGLVVGAAALTLSPKAQFLAGGAMVNAAYRMQDHIAEYDFEHAEVTPEQAWQEFKSQNELASKVREAFPRTANHPVVALLVCMDARLDTNELVGDTRRNYYIVRTAGSAMSTKEEEMLELAASNGVKLIVITRHSDCAAEKAAKNPELRAKYPTLVAAVDERDQRIAEFLARPAIASRIKEGKLMVKQLDIDTSTEHLVEPGALPSGSDVHAAGPAVPDEAHH